MFGVALLGATSPLGPESFSKVGERGWALELSGPMGAGVEAAREAAIFLLPGQLGPEWALALYVQCGSSDWEFRGCVTQSKPSDSFPVSWPRENDGSLRPPACLGVQAEPVAEAEAKEGKSRASREEFARRVALDLFRFMESFQGAQPGPDSFIVPGDVLDRCCTPCCCQE